MTRTAVLLALVATLAAPLGCAVPAEEAHPDDEPTGSTHEALSFASMTGNCYSSGGEYWCQDYYTSKWCTRSYNANGWDWKNCSWTGWNRDNTLYCSNGWQWGSTHVHCD